MIKILLILFVLLPQILIADENPEHHELVKSNVVELVQKCFPKLKDQTITIETLNESAVFFDTNVSYTSVILTAILTAVNPTQKRHYILRYNPKIFEITLDQSARMAILSHELNHILDYTNMTAFELLAFGFSYAFNQSFRAKYERSTDEKSLNLGFASGLITFRYWLYQNISAQDVERKKINYWTPDEIKAWTISHAPQHDCSQLFAL